jgi:phage terminase large subunit-like protein
MSQNVIAEIAKEFLSGNTTEVADIITFIEAPWGLNIKLLPVQRFILRCFYNLPLEEHQKTIKVPDLTNERILYEFTEKDFLRWLYAEGRCNTDVVEGKIFQELVLAIGRRGTKSSLASFISNYELYKLIKRIDPNEYYSPARTAIYILNVAPTDDQAAIVFDMIQNTAMQCPFMKERSLHNTMTYFDIQTDADMKQHGKPKASLLSIAGGCSSNSLRGRNAIVVIMDEMAHFLDNNGRFSGSEVYKALTPSIASFRRDGKVICISSPYAKYGSFYDRFQQSYEETNITLMFKMYSAMVNPTIPTEILAAARRRNRVGFMCEYGGEFSDSITAWIEDEAEFKKCVFPEPIPIKGVPETEYYMGIDLGFKNDGTALAIVHQDRKTNQIILDYANVWFSGSSDVWESDTSIYKDCRKYADKSLLVMSDIVAEVKELYQWFPIKAAVFDQSNGYGLAELFRKEGMKQFEMLHFTDQINSDVYKVVKMLYAEQLIHLFNHPVLVPELLSLEGEKKIKRKGEGDEESIVEDSPRGKVDVRAPNRKGAHDDISEAFARAVWLCYNNKKDRPPHIATGAGGSIGAVGTSADNGSGKRESMAEFRMRRFQQHGAHPRGLDGLKQRAGMSGSLMGRRFLG